MATRKKKTQKLGRHPIPGLMRTNITITEDLWNQLLEEAEREGVGASTLLRIILKERYAPKKKQSSTESP